MGIIKVPRLALLVVAFLLVVGILLIVPLLSVTRIIPENRTYIIGWDVDPPDQLPTESGAPTGFAVELIREAAKRRRIRLQWVLHPESSEAALRSKAVDLWPMMVITEDRKQVLHLTDPFQENEYGLLVDAKSALTRIGDLKQRTLSYDGLPFNGRLLREHFPGSVHLRKPSLAEAVRSLCVGEAQAVFVEHITAVALLLSGSPCPGTSLRMLPIPTIRTQIGIGATRESRAAADAIREEIGVMADDGSLQKIMGAWSYTSGQELASLVALQHAKSHLWWYRIGVVAVGGLLVFASWSAAGYRRQKMKSQAYSRALGQAERNVRLVADSLSEMVVAYDTHRNLIYANSGAEKMTGYGLAELQGAAPLSWAHPDDRPKVLELWDKAFDGQTTDQVMYRLIRKDGTVKWAAGSWGPVVDETGHQVGVRATCLDITERIVAEQVLQETTQKFRTIVEEMAERKRAEAALRESEERFRNMADSAPVMIWISDPEKLFTFVNKGWLDFTGRSLEKELGNGWAEGVHPEDRERFLGVYSSSIDARREFNSIFRLRRADGNYRWVLCAGVPRFVAGVFSGYIGSCVDVADQKLVEEQLRANEVRLKDALRLAKVGSWERRIADNSIYWSDEMLQILGLPNDPPVDVPSFLNNVHPRDREKIMETDRKICSGIASLEVEFRITQPSGSVRFVRSIVEAIRNDQSAVVRIAGATQDVTEQVMARELLRESEKHLKNAERLAHLGHWQWDIRANRVSGSEEMLRILGKPQNYVLNYEDFLQDLVPQDRERVERLIRDSIEKKIGYSTEYQIALPNRELRTISCICEVLLDEEGLPARMFGTCQDVTDQRQAEVSMRRSLDEIAHLNRVAAMGELTASIAHELNQPLAAILSNAQAANRFLNQESPGLAQVRECLTDIVADDKRAGEVIKTLRALLRRGKSQATLIDLNEVVSDALRLVGNDALLRQVSFNFEPLKGLLPVLGDRIQLYQVVLNLIMNGLDAVAERPMGDRWVLVRTAKADGGGVELTVEDSGKGIAEGDLARVFERFFTTKREGLGVGLSISRSIVEAHGGRIWAENSAGRGAIFHCVLPVAQQAAVAAAK